MPFSLTLRHPHKLKLKSLSLLIALFLSLLSRLFKSLTSSFSLLSPPMDHRFSLTDDDDDLIAVDSYAAGNNDVDDDDDDTFLLPLARRRRLSSSPPDSSLSLRLDRLFLVPFLWLREANEDCEREGVRYTASECDHEFDSTTEIVFELRRPGDDDDDDDDEVEEKEVVKREYALILESVWFKALKWHSDHCTTIKDIGCSLAAEDNKHDVFPIQIRLSVMRDTSSLMIKICEMDNPLLLYERACQIFDLQSHLLCIWDFSGQLTEFFNGNSVVISSHGLGHASEETLLGLQVYGLPGLDGNLDVRICDSAIEEGSSNEGSLSRCSNMMNGSVQNECSSTSFAASNSFTRGNRVTGLLGLTGLMNLGNTCFMNSAIQCLAHTSRLVDYFLGDFKKQINFENPLGMKGELALAFGDLLRKLWSPGGMPIAPRFFKSTLESFAPQFSGYNQHDSQEFLAFLLDGLHEDLNRVKYKPYIEIRDAEDYPDGKVADEYWRNHLARNDSIIVDLFHGQYRSTLVCPICKKVSVTFDPFMYLSLPLPSTTMRSMTVTVLNSDGNTPPSSFTVTVPKFGRCKDLIYALSVACSLRSDETLLVAEVYYNRILRFLEDPSDSLELIRDSDCLVAYRLSEENESSQLVVFIHERTERSFDYGVGRSSWRWFGVPLVSRISHLSNGSQIYDEYMKLLRPFQRMDNDHDDIECSYNELANMEEASTSNSDDSLSLDDETATPSQLGMYFKCHLTNERGTINSDTIKFGKPLNVFAVAKVYVLASWSEKMVRRYNLDELSSLPEIFKTGFLFSRPQESVSLYKCLEGFLKVEPLGLDDMWYCPSCKQHRQASKKLDLWRLPEILVVHLKRFSYSRYLRNKLETYVDFPVEELDLSGFLAHQDGSSSNRYKLYAVSNHYGGMGGGHYTALIHDGKSWYEFNDSIVEPAGVDDLKTSAAYVLFYHRIHDT